MERIALLEPCARYADDLWRFRQEIFACDAESEDRFAGCGWLDTAESAEVWIASCRLRRSEATCGLTGTAVPSHTYLAVREGNDRIVGIIDLRHHINHPVLGTWGGHCGYSVRPSERGRGYAREMLRLNLPNARAMGIPALLVTCADGNTASERAITGNGGVYEKTLDVDGRRIKRYWIATGAT